MFLRTFIDISVDGVRTLKCIFLYKRLRETFTGSRKESGGGIHATSQRVICTAEYVPCLERYGGREKLEWAGWLSLKDEGRTSLHLVRLDYLPLSRRGNRER